MSVYARIDEYKLRYSDCDFADRIKPSALLALTQESACMSADELGFGYADLKPKNVAFIIVNTYCEFYKNISLGDVLTVETWPLPPRRFFMERHYKVTSNGECVAAVASRWCLVDFSTFALRLPEALGEAHERCPYRDEKCVSFDWKMPKVKNGYKVFDRRVVPSDCDHYLHANNTRYADYFFDCFSSDELMRPVAYFHIAYSKQAKEGSTLEFYREDMQNGCLVEARCEGEVISRFALGFRGDGQ